VERTPSVSSAFGPAAKNKAPKRGSFASGVIVHDLRNIAHFWPKSMPYGGAKPQSGKKIIQFWQIG
jgi:hypothetical protein